MAELTQEQLLTAAEEAWANLRKGPMGTHLADDELTEEQLTDIEEGV